MTIKCCQSYAMTLNVQLGDSFTPCWPFTFQPRGG